MSFLSPFGTRPQSDPGRFRTKLNQPGRKGWRSLLLAPVIAFGVSVTIFAAVLPNTGFILTETQKVSPLDAATGDAYGYSVAVSGSYMIVGAYGDDDNGETSGSATIYERQGDAWIESAKLLANDGAAYDRFGYAVAIDGDIAIVGAYFNAPVNPYFHTGAVYVFERQADGSWLQQAKLIASDANTGTDFAKSVAISGNTAVIGAALSNSAYVYERGTDGSWSETVKLYRGNGKFGYSVAIDADRIVVGGLIENFTIESAKASVYERQTDGSWLETAEISGPGGLYPPVAFGRSVAVSDNTIIAGSNSGVAYIFEQQVDGAWLRTRTLKAPTGYSSYYFGRVVDIIGDRAVSSANPTSNSSGKVYIYEKQPNGQWVYLSGLIQSDDEINGFGSTLSISGDTVITGARSSNLVASNSGAAYIFSVPALPGSTVSFMDVGLLADGYSRGTTRDASRDGSVVVGNAYLNGVDYAFRWTDVDGVTTPITPPGSYTDSTANSISADGLVMAGYLWTYGGPYEAYRWTAADGLMLLGDLSGGVFDSRAFDISADGEVIVGYGTSETRQEAIYWTRKEGIISLAADLNTSTSSSAYGISADGNVIVGQSDGQAFRWSLSGQVDWLGTLPGHSTSIATAVSDNGQYVVGESQSADGSAVEAFLWSLGTGMVGLGHLPEASISRAQAVSNDGSVIIGYVTKNTNISAAFVWDSTHGMRQLDDVLDRNYGINLKGRSAQYGLGLTADGNTLLGSYGADGFIAQFSDEEAPNALPQLTLHSPLPGSVFSLGETVYFSVTASDAEDGNLGASVRWISNIDGILGYGDSLTLSTLSSGTHEITATVWDSAGATVFVRTSISANSPPVLSILAPTDGQVFNVGEVIEFSATADDTEDGDLSGNINWSSNIAGNLGVGGLITVNLPSGNHTITASVSDSAGTIVSSQISITVNSSPQLTVMSPIEGSLYNQGDSINLLASAIDDEDGVLDSAIQWSSNIDGVIGAGANITTSMLSPGQHTVIASVADSNGAVDTVTVNISINGVPDLILLTPSSGSSFMADQLVMLSAAATDLEDGDLTASIEWSSNIDGILGTGSPVNVLLSPGIHEITASVVDARSATTQETIFVEIEALPVIILNITTPKKNRATLNWSGARTAVDIYKDGVIVGTGPATGEATYRFRKTATFKICETGMHYCSPIVSVDTSVLSKASRNKKNKKLKGSE